MPLAEIRLERDCLAVNRLRLSVIAHLGQADSKIKEGDVLEGGLRGIDPRAVNFIRRLNVVAHLQRLRQRKHLTKLHSALADLRQNLRQIAASLPRRILQWLVYTSCRFQFHFEGVVDFKGVIGMLTQSKLAVNLSSKANSQKVCYGSRKLSRKPRSSGDKM